MVATVAPPSPATMLANPPARNSRSPVQILVHGDLQTRDVHDDGDECDQHQRQHVGALHRHRNPVHPHQVGGKQYGPKVAVGRAGQQQTSLPRLGTRNVERPKGQVIRGHGNRHADGQDEGMAPPFHGPVEGDAVGHPRDPAPEDRRFEQRWNRSPGRLRVHQGHGRQAHGAADSSDKAGGDRVGDETHQVGEPETPEHQNAGAGQHRTEYERDGDADEQGVAPGIHAGGDERHADDQRGRKPGDDAAIAARESDNQAGSDVAEQYQADTLGSVGGQVAGKYEGREGDLRDEQPEARNGAGRKGVYGAGGRDVLAKLGEEIGQGRLHRGAVLVLTWVDSVQSVALRIAPWSVPRTSSMASTLRAPDWKMAVAFSAPHSKPVSSASTARATT